MKLSLRARRRWALLILCTVWPLYVVAAVNLIEMFDRPHFLVELGIYAMIGIAWILPFRSVFRGISRKEESDESD